MNITFKVKDGSCPFYIYKNTKFLIMDYLDVNRFMYYLAEKDLTEEIITFRNHKQAMEHIKNVLNFNEYSYLYRDEIEEKYLFSDKEKDYIVNKNIIKIRNRPSRITLDFDNYYDCLNAAKRIVSERIKKIEPEQLKLI